jgi:predicted NBD/HSP70 family sugar kinase
VKQAERIHQIITAVSKEGPLPLPELVHLIPGLKDQDHLRKGIVAKSAGVLLAKTAPEWDLPKALTARHGNATHYVGVSRKAGHVVGLNVGRTYFAIGVADPNGRLLSTAGRLPPPRGGSKAARAARRKFQRGQIKTYEREDGVAGEALLNHIAGKTREWLEKVSVEAKQIRGVTVSLPAPVSTTQSKLLTKSLEVGLGKVTHISSKFKSALGPDFTNLEKVVVANDADVAARAEVRYGDAYGKEDVVVVHAAYGIGAGVLAQGNVLRTGAGGGIGEIGHCVPRVVRDEGKRYELVPLSVDDPLFECACQHTGHLEALAGGAAIVRRIKSSPDVSPKPPDYLAALLADPEASVPEQLEGIIRSASRKRPWEPGLAALLDAAHLIGGGVHTLVHVLRPEAVYVSGKLSEAGEEFLKEVQAGFTACGPLTGYEPEIALGTAADQFGRRHVMVRGAAMTAVRATKSLIDLEKIREELEAAKEGESA